MRPKAAPGRWRRWAHRGHASTLLLTVLLLVLAGPGLARAAGNPAPSQDHDILLSFAGSLFDQDEQRTAVTFRFELPGFEWVDADGRWNLEPGTGTGMATVLQADGASHAVPLTVRLTRYHRGGALALGADGSRLWSLRGDLYLQADGHPLIEMECGADVTLPVAGSTRTLPPAPPRVIGEDERAYVVRMMAMLPPQGAGGGLLYGRTVPLWGRPPTKLPYLGYIQLTQAAVSLTRRSRAERDADRLISRIQYISADYPLAVHDGAIINEVEYAEHIRLLQEARLLAENLSLAPEVRRGLDRVRELLDWKSPPSEVTAACRLLTQDLVRSLWLSMSPPEPGPVQEAVPLYAERCALCHGERGDGRTPIAAELDPPPANFLDPGFLARLSPYRAFNAISWGIPGTGMPAFDSLSARQRWSLAFFAFSFYHAERAVGGREAMQRAGLAVPLGELALQTDEDLAAWLERRVPASDTEPALAYLRTAEIDRASRSPLEAIRRRVREAARHSPSDPTKALAEYDEARHAFAPIVAALRVRSAAVAAEVEKALFEVRESIQHQRLEADVRAKAHYSLQVLNSAEETLATAAPRAAVVVGVLTALLGPALPSILLLGVLLIMGRWPVAASAAIGVMSGLVVSLVVARSHPAETVLLPLAAVIVLYAIYRAAMRKSATPHGLVLLWAVAAWLAIHPAAKEVTITIRPWLTEATDRTATAAGLAAGALVLAAAVALVVQLGALCRRLWPSPPPSQVALPEAFPPGHP